MLSTYITMLVVIYVIAKLPKFIAEFVFHN